MPTESAGLGSYEEPIFQDLSLGTSIRVSSRSPGVNLAHGPGCLRCLAKAACKDRALMNDFPETYSHEMPGGVELT